MSISSYSGSQPRALAVFLDQLVVRKCRLRIFVEILQVGTGRRRVEVEVILLYVFAVIAFVVRQAEEALFQNRIFSVPERQREADVLVPVADPADAVFAPAIRARARMVVRKIFPGVAVRAVVLANRAPLALGEIGPPALPVNFAFAAGFEALFFRRDFGVGLGVVPSRRDPGLAADFRSVPSVVSLQVVNFRAPENSTCTGRVLARTLAKYRQLRSCIP